MTMRTFRATSWTLAVLVGTLAGCSPAHVTAGGTRTARPAPGMTVQLPTSAGAVTAALSPGATQALTSPIRLDGRTFPSAIAVLAPARQLEIHGQFPAGGVVIAFRVRPGSVPPGTTPFLASLDSATGRWAPVASRYDPANGTVTARATHASAWAVLDWVQSDVADVLRGTLSGVFRRARSATTPNCTPSLSATITDNRASGAIGTCAQAEAEVAVLAKVTDLRHYPVELLYPSNAQVTVNATDTFTQLGEDFSQLASTWQHRVLLPAGAEADVTLQVPAGSSELVTEMDTEAYLVGVIGTDLNVLASLTGKFASTANVLDALAKSTCLRELANTAASTTLTPSAAEHLGALGFKCVASAVKLSADRPAVTPASIIESLAAELLGGVSGQVNVLTRNGDHILSVDRVPTWLAQFAGTWYSPTDGVILIVKSNGTGTVLANGQCGAPGSESTCMDSWTFTLNPTANPTTLQGVVTSSTMTGENGYPVSLSLISTQRIRFSSQIANPTNLCQAAAISQC